MHVYLSHNCLGEVSPAADPFDIIHLECRGMSAKEVANSGGQGSIYIWAQNFAVEASALLVQYHLLLPPYLVEQLKWS